MPASNSWKKPAAGAITSSISTHGNVETPCRRSFDGRVGQASLVELVVTDRAVELGHRRVGLVGLNVGLGVPLVGERAREVDQIYGIDVVVAATSAGSARQC